MANTIVWCDIPVLDVDRAIRFYSSVLGNQVKKDEHEGMAFGVFPHQEHEVAGCLFHKAQEKPSAHGPLLYFNCQGRLDQAIAAVEPNGGKIINPKHAIGPYGHRAIVLDSEGNRVALHTS